ncbi:hypothetical protein N7G274_009310 [Stereocaulon virgatum]|uniref:Uncharacterized protein n=1 Tax=Stereocaulon virgatum TaxID=373712 RepID=A0ABR3ZYR9_9LECA
MSTSGDEREFFSAKTHISNDNKSVYYGLRSAVGIPLPFRSSPVPESSSRILSDAENQILNDEIDRLIETFSNMNSAASAPSPFRETQSPGEPGRLLSDDDNEVLNDKIDRLIAAIQNGRQLRFSPDPETGNVNISAAYNNENLNDESDLEALIAASPENFGTIIRPGNHLRRIRSINSMLSVSSGSSQVRSKDSSNVWERTIAAANVRYALDQSSLFQNPTVVRNPLRAQAHGLDGNRGQYLAFTEDGKRKVRAISPIPFDFTKRPRPKTPSIHSGESELDCSSPLFEKSRKATLKGTHTTTLGTRTPVELSENKVLKQSVSSWLQGVETPSSGEETTLSNGKERVFGVFKDDESDILAAPKDPRPLPALQALKDISNLRRPGYLQKNSFANDKALHAISARPIQLDSPLQTFGGASDQDSRRSFIERRWPALLASNQRSGAQDLTQTVAPSDDEHFIAINKFQGFRLPEDNTAIDEDPERAAHFELALGRLEGRMPPPPSSPIKRYASMEGVYGSDVELETRRMHRRDPRPKASQPAGNVVEKLEAALAAAEAGPYDGLERTE